MKFKFLFALAIVSLTTGCPLEEDCSPEDNDYSHSEYDCYYKDYSVDVCDRDGCHSETRSKQVCEDVHVCYADEH
jgi:hypothetical protein